MKMSKKAVDRLQNLTLILLTLSALTLLTRIPLFSEGWDGQVQALLSSAPSGSVAVQAGDLTTVMPSVHLVSTDNSEYGRYSQFYLQADSPDLTNVLPLFRDALGSAAGAEPASDRAFQAALNSPSLFLSFAEPLPCKVIASWLGSDTLLDLRIRAMALTTGEDNSAALYLCGEHGSVFCYDTALTATAIQDCVATFSPNGGSFAFETAYSALLPYTVLVSQTGAYMDIYSDIPDGYSAYNLLTALDFNAHNNFRYFETNGTEVVRESPRTLHVSPDGTVVYNGDGYADSRLYLAAPSGGPVSAEDAVRAAADLAAALTEGTDASSLYLHGITSTATGWQIDFNYQIQGLPILLPGGNPALTVTIDDAIISTFSYCCRAFSESDVPSTLLPPDMAAAIAAQHPSSLTLCYTESIADMLSARWLAN